MRAVADYVTRESTLLSFRKGDVIRVVRDEQYVDKGTPPVFICHFFLSRAAQPRATLHRRIEGGARVIFVSLSWARPFFFSNFLSRYANDTQVGCLASWTAAWESSPPITSSQ